MPDFLNGSSGVRAGRTHTACGVIDQGAAPNLDMGGLNGARDVIDNRSQTATGPNIPSQ